VTTTANAVAAATRLAPSDTREGRLQFEPLGRRRTPTNLPFPPALQPAIVLRHAGGGNRAAATVAPATHDRKLRPN
jgi:hypothetical protein